MFFLQIVVFTKYMIYISREIMTKDDKDILIWIPLAALAIGILVAVAAWWLVL